MSQPPPLPSASPTPTPASAVPSSLTWRNWWRNGAACRIAVFASIIIVLNLFAPWEPDVRGAGYSTTEIHGNTKTTRWFGGVTGIGQGNAFTEGKGWAPFVLMLGTLWVCATPRANWGAMRKLPLIAGLVVTGIVFVGLKDMEKEWDAFNATLSTRAIVTYPAAMQGIFFMGILLAISGAFLARKPKEVAER